MPVKNIVRSVTEFLQRKNYKYLHYVHKEHCADMIAVLDPDGKKLAVKIVKEEDLSPVEDKYWKNLRHPNLHELLQSFTIEELRVKVYLMPYMTNRLEDVYHSERFRKNHDSFHRMRKWLLQVLSGLDYLHSQGLSHLNVKIENIFIDEKDNAVLTDFSLLNYSTSAVNRIYVPPFFCCPEYFMENCMESSQGDSFDLWSYSLMALNILTDDYFRRKTLGLNIYKVNWWKQIWPVIKKSLKEYKFERLLRKTFPNVLLTPGDIHQSLHFIKFILKIRPDERPNAARVKRHLFLKMTSNPFTWDHYNTLQQSNPFRNIQSTVNLRCESDSSSGTELEYEYYALSDEETINDKSSRKSTGKRVKNWFMKKINKIFK